MAVHAEAWVLKNTSSRQIWRNGRLKVKIENQNWFSISQNEFRQRIECCHKGQVQQQTGVTSFISGQNSNTGSPSQTRL